MKPFEMKTTLLINACRENAKKLFKEFQEFYPFAFGIYANQKITSVTGEMPDGDDNPSSEKVVESLQKALYRSNKEKQFEEVCICLDVRVVNPRNNIKTDAIQIKLNFRTFNPINYFCPYKIFNKEMIFDQDFYEDGEDFMEF